MPDVPAFCDTCGTAFRSGLSAGKASISISNVAAGPCPKCGGMGHVPDGLYKIAGNTIEVLANSHRSASDLGRIAQVLNNAKQRSATPQEIASTLKKELPELSTLADAVPRTRAELYAFVSIILAIITLLITNLSKNESPRIEVQQVINNVVEQADGNEGQRAQQEPTIKNPKVGRNDPCPCGSGKKYKKCCGRP